MLVAVVACAAEVKIAVSRELPRVDCTGGAELLSDNIRDFSGLRPSSFSIASRGITVLISRFRSAGLSVAAVVVAGKRCLAAVPVQNLLMA